MDAWHVYDAWMNAYGETEDERAVNLAKDDFIAEAVDNPDYYPNCKRNGVTQRFLVERTDVSYKAKFVTFPDEEIYPGDLIEVNDLVFIITDPPRFTDRVTWAAVGRLCNIDLKWQDFDGNICHSWASLDAGVYSTTMNGTDTLQAPDKQFRLYLPYNDDTAKLHLDKRIAVDKRYDQFGEQILECYRITGINRVAKTYGQGGHLLIAELRSSTYSPEHDNVEELICDWRDVDTTTRPCIPLLRCEILGRQQIRLGSTQAYTAAFYNRYGTTTDDVTPAWTLPDVLSGVVCEQVDNDVTISIAKNEDLVGEVLTLTLTAANAEYYRTVTMEIEVIA